MEWGATPTEIRARVTKKDLIELWALNELRAEEHEKRELDARVQQGLKRGR